MLFSIPVANMKLAMWTLLRSWFRVGLAAPAALRHVRGAICPIDAHGPPQLFASLRGRDGQTGAAALPRRTNEVRMRFSEGLIAVDWGTTNRRGYLLGEDGKLLDEAEDDKGILAVEAGGFPAAVAELRERLGDLPILLGGMIGSNRGWIEAPYVPCPAGGDELAAHIIWAEEGRTAIVPGLSFLNDRRADVMRGEEVQIFGALAAGTIAPDSLVCHPGTHNKWVTLESGRVTRFRTVMTGELFSLLKEHSILSDLLQADVDAGPAFEQGVLHGLSDEDVTAELFSVRARVLLDRAERGDAASYTSGLLIGTDLRTGLRHAVEGDEIAVMGRPELTRLYASALKAAGYPAREVDGEESFLAGARRLAEAL
jgi:2-dehydro-3-deoxygalactonokinase